MPASLANRTVSWATIAALSIAALSVIATLQTIDFPLGTIGDEWAKIDAVRSGHNFYYHPLLMIEVAQAANFAFEAPDLQSLVELGRACAAIAGGVLVFATFRLARLVMPDLPALAAEAATAVVPLVTVHARIFKEDIFTAPFLILALATLIELLRQPSTGRAILLGIFAGLAAGSKYIGMVFLPFALAAILLIPAPGGERRLARAMLVAGVTAAIFALVEKSGAARHGEAASRRLHRAYSRHQRA